MPKKAKTSCKHKVEFRSSIATPQPFVALAFHHNSNNSKGDSAQAGRYADVTLKRARPASYRANARVLSQPGPPLTFSPLGVGGDELVDQGHVFEALPLGLTDELRVAAFVGPKEVQVEHHLYTRTPPAGRERKRGRVEWTRSRTDVSERAGLPGFVVQPHSQFLCNWRAAGSVV